MCGIAGIVGDGGPSPAALAAWRRRWPTAAPTARARGATTRRASPSGGWRSSTSTRAPTSRCTSGRCTSSSTARSTTTASCATSCAALGHAFATEGDGEVLLHAWAQWGEARAGPRQRHVRLRDLGRRRARADRWRATRSARSRSTTRRAGGRLVFASDVARAAAPSRRDSALAPTTGRSRAYLARAARCRRSTDSFFAGVHRLPGAHLLRFGDGRAEVRRYWHAASAVDVPAPL